MQLNASVNKDGILIVSAPSSASTIDVKQAILIGTQVVRQELNINIGILRAAVFTQ